MHKTAYIITGPTAVGKTSFAIQLAKALNTEIISADARQCYQELNIGVARPSTEELKAVPHHFIASHSIHETVNASVFEQYALEKARAIFNSKNEVVMVGGTGLYIKAFCEGLDLIPLIDPAIRIDIIAQFETKGLAWLQKEIAQKDPMYWAQSEQENPQRLMRALEVRIGAGASILSFQKNEKKERPFKIVKIGLELERAVLNERINQRVSAMVENGLEREVRSLQSQFDLNALQTVGYQEWLDYFDGKISKEKSISLIQQNTRQYAKRQMTWFKKDHEIQWYQADLVRVPQIYL